MLSFYPKNKNNRKTKFLRGQQGAFLVEVLLAVVILSVGITLVVRSMAESTRALHYGVEYLKNSLVLENAVSGAAGLQNEAERNGFLTQIKITGDVLDEIALAQDGDNDGNGLIQHLLLRVLQERERENTREFETDLYVFQEALQAKDEDDLQFSETN